VFEPCENLHSTRALVLLERVSLMKRTLEKEPAPGNAI
jgi:hypothetical protein